MPGIAGLVALWLALTVRTGWAAETMPAPPAVSVAEVVTRNVMRWDEFPGHVEAVDTVEVRSRVAGRIERLAFREGGAVRKGDVLFVIDPRPFKAELMRAEAELERAQAHGRLARAQATRARKLIEKRAISEEEFEERVAAEAQSAADIRAAGAVVAGAALNLEYTEVRSPIHGTVGRALVTPGNLVQVATPLATIVSDDPVYVYFEGDERVRRRHRGHSDSVFVGLPHEQGFPHEGHMDFIDNRIDPGTGTLRARAVLANRDRLLIPGLFARVKLMDSGTLPAVLVDDKAVLTDQDRRYVYALGPDNTAQRRDVTLGPMIDGLRLVSGGLAGGDKVIVYGVQKIFFPGMAVDPRPIAMGDPPPGDDPAQHTAAQTPSP